MIESLTSRRAVLRPNEHAPTIEFVLADTAENGQRMFDKGITSITCSTTYPLDRWRTTSTQADLHIHPLNISVDVALPTSMDKKYVDALSAAIDRVEIARGLHGLVEPLHTPTDMWRADALQVMPAQPGRDMPRPSRGRTWKLVYPDFSPNRQLAEAVASQLKKATGLDLRPTAQSYEAYLKGPSSSHADCFRLVLRASPWPDPLSMILPYLQLPDVAAPAYQRLERIVRDIDTVATKNRDDLLREASTILDRELGMIPIARLQSVTRTRFSHFTSPGSGWTNYSANIQTGLGAVAA